MVLESTLGTLSQLADGLNARPAPSVERTGEEMAKEAKVPEQGDIVVSISEEARALAAAENPGETSASKEEEQHDLLTEQLKRRIEKLEEEIKLIEEGDLPEKEKMQQLQDKQTQLMELKDQLLKAELEKLKAEGFAEGGGTRAKGFGNSVDSF